MKLVLIYIFISAGILFLGSCTRQPEARKGLVEKKGILYKNGSDKPFTGTEKAIEKNRILEYQVVNGKKNGIFKISLLDGTPQMIGYIKDNKNVGLWKYYFENGTLESKGHFENNYPQGKWFWYYSDGNLREEGFFEKGISEGIWTKYDYNGKVVSKSIYKDGKKISAKNFRMKKINGSEK